MIVLLAVASLCTAVVILGLLAVVCRYREASWFASETSVLCVATPAVMLFGALGFGSLAWVALHGGFAAAFTDKAVIGSLVIVVSYFIGYRLTAARIHGRRRAPLAGPPATPDAA